MNRRKPLPARRQEKMLAQIAAMLAWVNGNKAYKFSDADLYAPGWKATDDEDDEKAKPVPDDDGTAISAAKVFSQAAGSRVHVIKVKKKGA